MNSELLTLGAENCKTSPELNFYKIISGGHSVPGNSGSSFTADEWAKHVVNDAAARTCIWYHYKNDTAVRIYNKRRLKQM